MRFHAAKKQTQFKAKQSQYAGLRPEIRSTNLEIRNKRNRSQMTASKAELKGCYLKKQSQFVPARNGVNSFLKGYYGNKPVCRGRKNKAKQSQFQGTNDSFVIPVKTGIQLC